MQAIILLGAPGSGKGTVSEKIKAMTDFVHIATGDMLREAVKQGTPVGKEAEAYMKRGELVPDSVIIRLVEDRLDRGSKDGRYMFDGFPRTVPQAELLGASLTRRGGTLTHVFQLDTPRDVLMKRLTGRRVCKDCGATFHVVNIPPKKEGVCDACQGPLYQRADDKEETIARRLDVYNAQTESLIAHYGKKGVLVRVNSDQGIEKLVGQMLGYLNKK
jgi:adenylate kinase